MNRLIATTLAICLLATAANALKSGDRVSISMACSTADDALEIGVSIDRKLENVADVLHDKIVDGACFFLLDAVRRADAVLVSVAESAENTDVWEVRTDAGRTLFVPYDREPSL